MNLIIDAGNTSVKLAVFNEENLLFDISVESEKFIKKTKEIFISYPKINWAIVSAVGRLKKEDITTLASFCQVHELDHTSKVPFKNLYETPETLGVDRIALAMAAYHHNSTTNTLVIDAGTCITYDMINANGEYLGGSISPGVHMRYEALHNQTSKLPLLELKDPLDLIGNTTETSIHSGVIKGILAEIDGVINQYRSRFEDLTVILTGGDAQFLSKRLKNTIFADSKCNSMLCCYGS